MLIYLALFRFRPWTALSRRQRRFVWRNCVHPLLTHWPLLIVRGCLLFSAMLAVVLPDAFHGWRLYLAIFLVVFLVPDLLDVDLVARFRPKIGGYIQEHGSEIQSMV